MGKASSAKKVARAARAGGKGARTGQRRSLLFPATISAIFVLGALLIGYARTQHDAEAVAPGLTDHWHAAYGVEICGELEPHFTEQRDPNGIHTHGDGVIHIHPGAAQQVARVGRQATLGVFVEAVGAELTDSQIVMPDGTAYVEGEDQCDGEDAIVQVARWARASDAGEVDPQVFTEGLADLHFRNDGEAYTIAFAPRDAELSPPATVDQLDALGAVDSGDIPDPGAPPPDLPATIPGTEDDLPAVPTTAPAGG